MALSDLGEIPVHNRADFKGGIEYVRTRFSLYAQARPSHGGRTPWTSCRPN